jgi:hypothetical protein
VLVIVAASFLGGSLTTYVLQRFCQTSRPRGLSSGQQISQPQIASGAAGPSAPAPPPVLPVAAPAPAALPAEPAAATAPSPASKPEAPATPAPAASPNALPARVEIQPGEGLAKIIDQYYPGEYRKGLAAIVLANPELDGANVTRPGQVVILPRIDFRSRSVQLQDGLFYTLYGSYYSVASWHGDKPWLEKSGVRFLVRVSRDAAGKTLHRVFLGGYERLEDLRAAQQVMHARSKHGRLPWGEVLAITTPPARQDGAAKAKAPAPAAATPAAPSVGRPASPLKSASESSAAAPPEEPSLAGEASADTPRLSARLAAWCEAMGRKLAGLGQFFRSREQASPQESLEPSETPPLAPAAAVNASESRPATPLAPPPAPSAATAAAPTSQAASPPVSDLPSAKQSPGAAPSLSLPASPPEAASEMTAAAALEDDNLGGATSENTPRLTARLAAWGQAMGESLAALAQFCFSRETAALTEASQPSETAPAAPPAAITASRPQPAVPAAAPPPPLADLLNRQIAAHKGESLTQIAIRNYGNRDKTVLTALILANEEIDTENMIHPGQVLNLPRVDLAEQIIQLPDSRYYALYGRYHSAASWEADKPWLAKNGVRFLVRVTRDAAGGKVQRVFLGGYDKVADLQAARQLLQIKSGRAGRSPETAPSGAGSPALKDREALDQTEAPPGKLAALAESSRSLGPAAPVESPGSPPRDSRPAGINLAAPWLKSLTFGPPAAGFDPGRNCPEAMAVPAAPPPARETAAPPAAAAPPPAAESPAMENKSAPGPAAETETKATRTPPAPPAPQNVAPLLAAIPQPPQAAAPLAGSPAAKNLEAADQPAAPPVELAAAEASPRSMTASAPAESPGAPPRDSRPAGINLTAPWANSLGFSSPAAGLDGAPNRPESTVTAAPPPARETAAPPIAAAPPPAAESPAMENKSAPGPAAETKAPRTPPAPPAPQNVAPLLAALPQPPQAAVPLAGSPAPKNLEAADQPAAPPVELAAAEASPRSMTASTPAESPAAPPRDSRPAGLSLGPPWANSLGFSSPAAELDAAPNRPESTVTAAPPSTPEAAAPQVAQAPALAAETPAAEGNSSPIPAPGTKVAQAANPSRSLENEAPLPETMLPEAAPSLPLLKFPAGLTDSFQRYWHSHLTLPGGLWPLLKSLWQALIPAGSLPALEPEAASAGSQVPGAQTPPLAAAAEAAPTVADPAVAPTSPANIRRYLDAGGVFHIENRIPPSGSAELYVEPKPEALESFLKAKNDVPLPGADNAPAGQPFREVSWPGGIPAPLPAPDSKAAEKVLPPEGTVRRYRDALGVLHVVNGELHNPGNPGEALLARLDPETREAAAGSKTAPEPAGEQAKGGWPITRVAFPDEKNAPVLPPAATPAEKALAPEDLIRRYRDVKGVLHIVNLEPKEPAAPSAAILAGAEPADSSGKPNEPRRDDRQTVVWPIKTASLTESESRLPAPPAPAPPESPWVNEGAIRRYRDAKGVLHIKTTEYPKPPLPPNWPAVGRLARQLPFGVPGLAPGSGGGAQSGLPQTPKIPEVVAFRDQRGRLHVRSFGPEDPARKTALELNRSGLEPIIIEAAVSYHLPVPLIQAVIKMESNFVPWAVSPKGAMGLMQLMPGTADFLGVAEPFNPRENIMGGCRYLRLMLDSFNDNLALALAAYNAGYQRVIEAGYRVPEIKETQDFVTGVLSRYYTLVLASRPAKI